MTADDIATNAGTSGEEGQIDRSLWPRPTVFVEVCTALPLAAIALLYLPHLTGYLRALVVVPLLAFPVAVIVGRLRRRRTISLQEDGIATDRGLLKWEEITRIDVGPPKLRPIVLHIDRPPYRRLALPRSLPVLRKVIPAILARRPDLEVKGRLRRLLADPASAARTPRWGVALLAALPIGLALMPLLMRQYGFLAFAFMPLPFLLLFLWIPVFTFPAPLDAKRSFIMQGIAMSAFAPMLAIPLGMFLPIYLIDTVFALCAVLAAATCVVAWPGVRLTPMLKAAILLLTLGVPTAVYALADRVDWPRTDITGLTGDATPLPPFFWSPDGRLAAVHAFDNTRDGPRYVLDVVEPRAILLPTGEESVLIHWLDPIRVVWIARTQDMRSLHLYTFADDRDRTLAASPGLVAAFGRCVSPDGRTLCWLESEEKGPKATAKLYALATGETRDIPVTLPDRKGIGASDCRWVDDDGLAVVAFERESEDSWSRPRSVHVLRLDVASGTSTLTSIERTLRDWRISPDCRFAFATTADDEPQLVDLHSGTVTPFGGTALPHWTRDGRRAFRVERDEDGDRWLCEFEAATGAEKRLLKVPTPMAVQSVSPRGRFALLRPGILMPPRLTVVDLATMERKRLHVWSWSIMDFNRDDGGFLGLSHWSPDERRFAVASMSLSHPTFSVYVYSVPDDWAGPPPATMPAAARPRP